MTFRELAVPNANRHSCKVPDPLFRKRWIVWECDACGSLWRKEIRPDQMLWSFYPLYLTPSTARSAA